MHLLVFAALYHPYRGGYVQSIHGLLKRLIDRGWTVTVLTCQLGDDPEEEQHDGVTIVRIPCWNPKALNESFPIPKPTWKTCSMLRSVMKRPIDIVSTQTRFFLPSVIGAILGRCYRLPVLHTERGATHTVGSSRLMRIAAIIIDHTLGTLTVTLAHVCVGVSQAAADFLSHIKANNPRVIPNGVDVSYWIPSSARSYQQVKRIVFVGRLIYGKGVQDLLCAVAALKTPINVDIVGDGPARAQLEQQVADIGLNQYVVFYGSCEPIRVRELLEQADIFVNPSHSEGLPRCVLEAAASGLPIIATDVGGTKEILPSPRHGILIGQKDVPALTNALCTLISNQKKRESLGYHAQRHVREHYSWDMVTQQYDKLLRELCAAS